ncbi:unnamed protein product, partial [Amoebophrya sp. A25]
AVIRGRRLRLLLHQELKKVDLVNHSMKKRKKDWSVISAWKTVWCPVRLTLKRSLRQRLEKNSVKL